MTLTVRMEPDDHKKLDEIVKSLQTGDRSSAVRQLIDEKWRSLQTGATFLERRGAHPTYLLNGEPNSSDRSVRKKVISDAFKAKATARKRPD